MSDNIPIPPIVEDMIKRLFDASTPQWNKDNISATLRNIEIACADANKTYLKRREKLELARRKR